MTRSTTEDLLPPRYHDDWREPFDSRIAAHFREGMSILDIGSGRNPAIPLERRPAGATYVGLDLSSEELEAAGPGAYDELVVADASALIPDLQDRFDLAVSWQVLEHVPDLPGAIDNCHSYLHPGGRFVAMFSGGRSAFGLINRVIPSSIGSKVVTRVMERSPTKDPVFPAYYDHCTYDEVEAAFSKWSNLEVLSLYRGAGYFNFSRVLTRAYLSFEDRMERNLHRNWATHYLVNATR